MREAIVHVSPALFGDEGVWGGGERYALELARAQSEHRPTRLVTFGQNPRRFADGALSVHVIRPRFYYHGHFLNPISEALIPELFRAKVVHVHQTETALADWTLAWCKVLGRRAFATDLGGGAASFSTRFDRTPVVERHLALSRFAAGFHPGWQHRTSVIGAGVKRTATATAAREEVIVFVGRLMPYKGIDVLLRAVPENVPVEIYGRPYDARYYAYLKDLANGRKVRFVHDASDAEISRAYQRARVVVLPSTPVTVFGDDVPKMELFGLTLAEAMSYGTPVICSQAGAMPEVVEDGESGLLAPPGDVGGLRSKLMHLLTDDAEWERLSQGARVRAAEFTWDAVARRCFREYDRTPPPRPYNGFTPQELRRLFHLPKSWSLRKFARTGS